MFTRIRFFLERERPCPMRKRVGSEIKITARHRLVALGETKLVHHEEHEAMPRVGAGHTGHTVTMLYPVPLSAIPTSRALLAKCDTLIFDRKDTQVTYKVSKGFLDKSNRRMV
jgi:hypothetical protein